MDPAWGPWRRRSSTAPPWRPSRQIPMHRPRVSHGVWGAEMPGMGSYVYMAHVDMLCLSNVMLWYYYIVICYDMWTVYAYMYCIPRYTCYLESRYIWDIYIYVCISNYVYICHIYTYIYIHSILLATYTVCNYLYSRGSWFVQVLLGVSLWGDPNPIGSICDDHP